MRKFVLGIGIAVVLLLAPMAAAQTFVAKRTYEFGPIGDNYVIECMPYLEVEGTVINDDCDPTGTTQDGSIDGGGAYFGIETTQDFQTAQASVVDDIFGANVVGFWLCSRLQSGESGGWCDDEGETLSQSCGSSPAVDLPDEPYDGLVVFLNGFVFQALDCDSTQAPSSTTGGYLDPAGGMFVTLAA